jgi:hypothetical protein
LNTWWSLAVAVADWEQAEWQTLAVVVLVGLKLHQDSL